MNKRNQKTLRLTVAGMLIALEIIMAFTPIGYLKIGLLSITFMTVPVIIGAVTNGLWMGAVLGLTFGVTSFVQCFGMDAFGTTLFGLNPIGTFIMCVCTRTLMGFLCALIYKGLSKTKAPAGVQVGVSAFSAPFLNTAFFVPCLILFFWKSDYIQSIAAGANVLKFIVTLVGVNGIVEWVVCTVVGAAVALGLKRALKRV
ncbi:MAG: ECF transporter S component [Clostridia bacterium]|nr:ECF transporter S component [Clostridia bacterium]MBQ9505821.1 ECF transporter S component [Clostridia bacterium]